LRNIEDSGRSEYRALESCLEVLLAHLLKVKHQPEMQTNSWDLTIKEQRLRIQRLLRDNPGLKPKLPRAWEEAWAPALIQTQRETGLGAAAFPQENSFALDEVIASAGYCIAPKEAFAVGDPASASPWRRLYSRQYSWTAQPLRPVI
jgi:Domain of unknown function DUF29